MVLDDYVIAVATPDDTDGIMALQDANQPDRGGVLSVRLPRALIEGAVATQEVMVARRGGAVVGYVITATVATQMHIPIMQAMLRAWPAAPETLVWGPICIAESERGRGLAGAMSDTLHGQRPGRDSITFIRRDNAPSRRAHAKMGMREVADFTHDGVELVVLVRPG